MKTIANIQALWRGYALRRDMPAIKEFILETGDMDVRYIMQMCNMDRYENYMWLQHRNEEHDGNSCDCDEEESGEDMCDRFYSFCY